MLSTSLVLLIAFSHNAFAEPIDEYRSCMILGHAATKSIEPTRVGVAMHVMALDAKCSKPHTRTEAFEIERKKFKLAFLAKCQAEALL